jgi:5-methylcytosine-specific restriction endonuclease McrA
MICTVCPRDVPTLLDGLYCSFRCRSVGKKKKAKQRKPLTTGSRERKARIRGMVKSYTQEDWQKALSYFENKCAYCGKSGHMQQEHYYSVLDGGTYTPDNIIPACSKCNSSKSNKDPLEWLLTKQEHGLVTMWKISQYFSTLPVNAPERL